MHTEEVGTPYTENVQQITNHHSIALITLNDGLVNSKQYSPDGRMAQTATDTKAHRCQLIIGQNPHVKYCRKWKSVDQDQDRSVDLQSHEWYGTTISGTICPCHRPAWPTGFALCSHQSSYSTSC